MISVICNGNKMEKFSSVQVTRALDQFCSTYSLQAIPENGAWLPMFPEDMVEILENDDVVVRGYNDECRPSFDYSGGCSFGVTGREIVKDIVDCPPQMLCFEHKRIDEIVRIICAEFGVTFVGSSGADIGAPLEKFSGDPGKSAYEVMMEACKLRRCIPFADGAGNVRIDGARYGRSVVDLTQGVNVLSASGNFSTKNRYKVYRVTSSSDYSGKTFAEVVDEESARNRRWVMIDERWSTKECCEDRAMWEAKHRQAVANSLTVSVDGWRQNPGGPLWAPGLIVRVNLPAIIGEPGEYLINRVNMRFDSQSGLTTSLSLVDPNCYSPAPGFPVAKKSVRATKAKRDTWASIRAQTGSKLR